jgi:HNH endonuclease
VTYVSEAVRRAVFERAGGRCEYCLIHSDDTYQPHEIDHIYAEKHGGPSDDSNLCLSCYSCNRNKGSDLASLDPVTGEVTRLFHPRRDEWNAHFRLVGAVIEGITREGRATVEILRFNSFVRISEREGLIRVGRY